MLDTVILQLNYKDYCIQKYDYFGTTKEQVADSKAPFKKWVNNPTAKDKKDGIYKPRLTLIKRGIRFILKIEFSAPKLIFNNNIDELDDNDFELVIDTLRKRLYSMGVIAFSAQLEKAEVISFHPSKNIPLTNGYTANLAIKELNKIDCSKRFDFDEKNYRNNGEVLQFYTRAHSFVIYDKLKDVVKPQKRAIDKDQTKQQLSLFDFIKNNEPRLELLRMEMRLSTKQKMNDILDKVSYPKNPTFRDIFNQELCKKIVNYYWDTFFADNRFLFSIENNPQTIIQLIFLRYPKVKTSQAMKLVGLYLLCKDEAGMRGFRQIIESRRLKKIDWQVLKRDLSLFNDDIFTASTWGFINDIKNELSSFKPLKIEKTEKAL